MQGHKYQKSIGHVAKRANGVPMQCKQFDTSVTAPCKGSKPKLWGFHTARNAKPSLCVVRDAQGKTLRIVKSVRVR
jgi:hypothetical protein